MGKTEVEEFERDKNGKVARISKFTKITKINPLKVFNSRQIRITIREKVVLFPEIGWVNYFLNITQHDSYNQVKVHPCLGFRGGTHCAKSVTSHNFLLQKGMQICP